MNRWLYAGLMPILALAGVVFAAPVAAWPGWMAPGYMMPAAMPRVDIPSGYKVRLAEGVATVFGTQECLDAKYSPAKRCIVVLPGTTSVLVSFVLQDQLFAEEWAVAQHENRRVFKRPDGSIVQLAD